MPRPHSPPPTCHSGPRTADCRTRLAALRQLDDAGVTLDTGLAAARESQARYQRAAALLDQALLAARSSVAAAGDFINTRRGAVGSEAGTRLAEARRHLDAAEATARQDPSTALSEAQQADRMAEESLRLAQSDVSGWSSPYGEPQGGGGLGGGGGIDLGSLVLGGILFGGRGGGWGGSGGWSGGGGGGWGAAAGAAAGRRAASAGPAPVAAAAGAAGSERRGLERGDDAAMGTLSAEEQAVVDTVRTFVDREVRPVVRELEHANTYPEALIEQMKQLGIFGLAVPEEYGGVAGVDAVLRAGHRGARPRLDEPGRRDGRAHRRGEAARRRSAPTSSSDRYLPRMATGEVRATMALTEPGGGSDLQAMRPPRARRDGDDYVVERREDLDQQRPPGRADRAAVQDRSRGRRRGTAGCSILLVEHGPGLTVSKDLPKLGYKGVESCELIFDGYRAPTPSLLGGVEGRGFAQMMNGLETGRIQVAARALGVGAGRVRRRAALRPGARERSASRSGSTSRSATTWPTWPPSSPPPASSPCTPPSGSTPASAATWRRAWPSCSPPRPR